MAKKTHAATRTDQLKDMETQLKAMGVEGLARPLPEQPIKAMARMPTRSVQIDWATCGGIPIGRITELYGSEASGKTTLALTTAAAAQQRGNTVAYIDAEYALDQEWAKIIGVDINTLRYVQPETGEEALQIVEVMAKSGAIDLIVVDSVAALVPQAILKGDIGDAHVGVQARLMSQGLQRLVGVIGRANCALVFINQLRERIGTQGYGSPETTPGGRALKFYATLRLDLRRALPIKQNLGGIDTEIGRYIRVKVSKNKGGPPLRQVLVPLMYRHGIDLVGEVLDVGVLAGAFTRKGAYYYQNGTVIGQGRPAALKWLRTQVDLQDTLRPKLATFLDTGEVISES